MKSGQDAAFARTSGELFLGEDGSHFSVVFDDREVGKNEYHGDKHATDILDAIEKEQDDIINLQEFRHDSSQ